jgi:general secretion pathway protein G
MKQGFTLIELMVVVIIIAALAAMIMPHVLPRADQAKREVAAGEIAGLETALKFYRLDKGKYPSSDQGLRVLLERGPSGEPYLEKKKISDPWDRPYRYKYPGANNPTLPDIWSEGPDDQTPEDNVNNW